MLKPIDKQTARTWYQYLAEPFVAKMTGRVLRATGPRIAVVGNCQSFSVAYSMQLLCPTAKVDHFPVISLSRLPLKFFARTLATYDHVLMHEFSTGLIPGGGSIELRGLLKKPISIPMITFAAFHPDCVYAGGAGDDKGAPVFGPLGPYHSALALFAFRVGLSPREANALYNNNVFEALRYFDFWNAASAELIEGVKQTCGLDLSAELSGWARRGIFMYSVNHPKPFVLVDVAKKLLKHIGISVPDIDYENYLIDDFIRYPVFPVYPPVGARYGCPGSYTFKVTPAHAPRNVGDYLLLPQFLSGSYERYRKCDSARLSNHRVDSWLGDKATTDMLVSLARENLRAGLLPVR
ncbi:MAG: WcbI family polysaccharide biosynthesis putative acetyltransferase [Methylocystis sp.]